MSDSPKYPPVPWTGGRVPEHEEPDTCLVGADGVFFARVVGTPGYRAEGVSGFILAATACHADLLAACEDWLAHLDPGDNLYSAEETLLIRQMRAAVARARGEG